MARDLTERQRAFCREYFADPQNGKQAAIRAGYSKRSAEVTASRLLTKEHVQDELARLRKDVEAVTGWDRTRYLGRLLDLIEVDPLDFFDENGQVLPISDIPLHARRRIAGIKVNEISIGEGANTIKLGVVKELKLEAVTPLLALVGKHIDVGAFHQERERVDRVMVVIRNFTGREHERGPEYVPGAPPDNGKAANNGGA